jgi:hypothetical protein
MTILCIEDTDEKLLKETLTILLKRNKKRGKKVLKIDKLKWLWEGRNILKLKLANTVIGIDRIDLFNDEEFFNFIRKAEKLKNSIIYTCKNVYSVPVKLRLETNFFAVPVKKKRIIKLIIFRNTPVLEKFIIQHNLLSTFLKDSNNIMSILHLGG